MNIKSAKVIYFSPTRTTKKILQGILEGLGVERIEYMDFTAPDADSRTFQELSDDVAVIGVPVYSGRIPPIAASRLAKIRGNNTPAVVVAVYGNREYEDALLELRDLAQNLGFAPVAGGTFIGEHSYSTEDRPIAEGRPDAEDLKKAGDFGVMIREKIVSLATLDTMPPLEVPGNHPYVEREIPPSIPPVTLEELCTLCGECADVCPTGAIIVNETVTTDEDACISCCACVKICPDEAKVLDDPKRQKAAEWLHTHCRERKEPELFL